MFRKFSDDVGSDEDRAQGAGGQAPCLVVDFSPEKDQQCVCREEKQTRQIQQHSPHELRLPTLDLQKGWNMPGSMLTVQGPKESSGGGWGGGGVQGLLFCLCSSYR